VVAVATGLLVANLHVLGERKYVINTFAEAEVICRSINPTNKEALASPHWVVADLKCLNSWTNFLSGLSMAFLQQALQHHVFILQKEICKLEFHRLKSMC
jgi:hypothetical protein